MAEMVQIDSKELMPINLSSLRIDSTLDFNLYIEMEQEFVLFRAPSLPFTEKTRKTLLDNGVERLYVPQEDKKSYHRYIERHLSNIINDDTITEDSKSAIIYDSAKMVVKDLLEKPSLPENLQRSLALVESTTLHLLKTESSFQTMLKVMSFNYTTYTHSVNVCTIALALARKMGIRDNQNLHHLGIGALLHDIGKSKISAKILDKKGPLDTSEMEIIKRHPQYGFELIINSEIIPHESHYPILQHHEREDGSGYPHNLISKEIHRFSKIVAIADVFDAMTTQRSYRNAKDAYPALTEMYDTIHTFDKEMLVTLTNLLGAGSN
ncbi:MAG: HD domain-containing phosphohydrolase [candidate division Zixibacteria bacterium]